MVSKLIFLSDLELFPLCAHHPIREPFSLLTLRRTGGGRCAPPSSYGFFPLYLKYLYATNTWEKFLALQNLLLRMPIWKKLLYSLSEHCEIWVWKSPMQERVNFEMRACQSSWRRRIHYSNISICQYTEQT